MGRAWSLDVHFINSGSPAELSYSHRSLQSKFIRQHFNDMSGSEVFLTDSLLCTSKVLKKFQLTKRYYRKRDKNH